MLFNAKVSGKSYIESSTIPNYDPQLSTRRQTQQILRHIDFQAATGNMPPAKAKTFWWTVLGLQFCFTQSISAAADDTPPKVKVVNSLLLYYSTLLFHIMKNIAKGITDPRV